MKKISFLFMIAIFGFGLIISSCNKDGTDYSAPLITLTPADDTLSVAAGETITYTITVNSQDELVSVKLTSELGTNQQILLDSTIAPGNTTFNLQIDLSLPANIPPETVGKLTVFAATANESTILESYMKVVETMTLFTDVTLQAQADGIKTVEENLSFYSTSTNERFTYNEAETDEASALIDLVFTHHSIFKTNAEMSFQSPDEENLVIMWNDIPVFPFNYDVTNKRETFFKKISNVDWDNLDYQGIDDAVGNIGTDKIARGLNNGDYVAFKTQDNKLGIIRITGSFVEHNPYNESTITFDVKAQY